MHVQLGSTIESRNDLAALLGNTGALLEKIGDLDHQSEYYLVPQPCALQLTGFIVQQTEQRLGQRCKKILIDALDSQD